MASKFDLMLITSKPDLALFAEESGVDRIFVDLEVLGKEERQKNLNLPMNKHTFADIRKVKNVLKKADVMARINPPNKQTPTEVSQCIDAGADCIMLPYFNRCEEVEAFLKAVNGQCKTNLLLETAAAVARAETILSLPIDEVHFGLNDLKLTFNLDFLYEPVSGGLVDFLCAIAKKNNISYGFGGVGSINKKSDVAPTLILKEHARLKSERVILSRAFTGNNQDLNDIKKHLNLADEVSLIREHFQKALARPPEEVAADQKHFNTKVSEVARRIALKNLT